VNEFTFHRPKSIAEALGALGAAADGKLLAGGQSLLPVMKLDMAQPSDLISLAGVDELRGITEADGAIRVGALTTHAEVEGSDLVRSKIAALAAMAGKIGDAQVRNRGTLGGSIAHADPAADYPAAVLGLGATVITDRREIAADDYFLGLFETALADDELIVAVKFPIPERAGYAKFASPASRFAVVGVFVAQTGGGVRVAVTGAGASAFRVEAMETALGGNFVASAIAGVTIPADELNSDLDASAEFRAHLVGVMARRAVAAAVSI
jgi:carbon-monoxide dehydrogenase medium subunit